jgi:hypothetical protein
VFSKFGGKRYAKELFSTDDEFWNEIPYGAQEQPKCLDDPRSWKPNQLAIALLAKELGKSYQTIEKQIRYNRNPASYKKPKRRK